ncbi:MAG TPA: CUAEP/CCAEP-tail radical SAM protein, partial [Bryobacteraceae bacterium]|nr:CUAEP/CCAEP-tail radical SAM protein [Bryobacteraceae bacterium]
MGKRLQRAVANWKEHLRILLISTYELGRQPFGLASPAAWLGKAGAEVACLDLARQPLDEDAVRAAAAVAFYLPMHTATRLAIPVIERTREINPAAHLCAYGLYAPMNAGLLRRLGVRTIAGGEFEESLLTLIRPGVAPLISLERLQFVAPERGGLPALAKYAQLVLPGGARRTVGYTEASRGCKHWCRHCPVVPVYQGNFRTVQREVVLEDIRRQVAAGAQHITFGDPDFFNGIRHAAELVSALNREFPRVTYDVTIKIEHLLKHSAFLPLLRDTGCAFVVSAVESVDDFVLREILDKGHTRADFVRVAELFRGLGLVLTPTFVAFHPWMTLADYAELLSTIAELDLVEHVSPVQLAIRLLVPAGSRLLELPAAARAAIGEFDEGALSYRWVHADPRVDALQRELEGSVARWLTAKEDRRTIFRRVWKLAHKAMGASAPRLPDVPPGRPRV